MHIGQYQEKKKNKVQYGEKNLKIIYDIMDLAHKRKHSGVIN